MRNFKNTEFGGFGKCENQDLYVFFGGGRRFKVWNVKFLEKLNFQCFRI